MAPVRPGSSDPVTVTAIGGEGDGMADGLYLPGTLPGETVRVGFEGGEPVVLARLSDSPERVTPPCPHFGACGGCALQHWAHAPYLAWKLDRLRGTLARHGIEAELAAPFASPPASRRRLALHARRGERGIARLGYKARGAWRLVEIEVCPIALPVLQRAIPTLKRLAAPLFEHPKSAPTLHVTATDTGLDIDITGVEKKSGGLSGDARRRLADIAAEAGLARVSLDGEAVYGRDPPRIRIGRATVELPPGAFLQAVAEAEAAMAGFALEALAGAKRVADLYCGVGAFAYRLAEQAGVHAVDASEPAVRALKAAQAGAPGLKGISAEVRDLVRRPMLASELNRFDAVLIDPPRAGAIEQTQQIARSALSRVVGASCNPATFGRDARVLIDAGFRLERILPVDQFLWSPHLELISQFVR